MIFTEVDGVERLIYLLRTNTHEKIREACAWCVRYLVHGCNMEHVIRSCAGAIPLLVKMLSFSRTDTAKEAATWAICSLASDITLCMLIIDAGALGPLFSLLKYGTESCKEAAAWTFQNIGPTELRKEGYSLPLLRETGISLSVLAAQRRIDGINICTMASDGFTFQELQEGGFDIFGFLYHQTSAWTTGATSAMAGVRTGEGGDLPIKLQKDIEDILEAILILANLESNLVEMLQQVDPQHPCHAQPSLMEILFHLLQEHNSFNEKVLVRSLDIYLRILRSSTPLSCSSVRESVEMGYIDNLKHLLVSQQRVLGTRPLPLPSHTALRINTLALEILCELSMKSSCYKLLIMGNQSIVSDLTSLLSQYLHVLPLEKFNLETTAYPAIILFTLSILCQDSTLDLKKSLGRDPNLSQLIVRLLNHTRIPQQLPSSMASLPSSQAKYFFEYDHMLTTTPSPSCSSSSPTPTSGGSSSFLISSTITCPLACCRVIHLIACDTISRDLYGSQHEIIPLLIPFLSSHYLQYSEAALKALRSLIWYHNNNMASFVDSNGVTALTPLLHRGYDQIKIEILWIFNNLMSSYSHLLLSNSLLVDTLFNLIHHSENKECQEVAIIALNSLIQQAPENIALIFPDLEEDEEGQGQEEEGEENCSFPSCHVSIQRIQSIVTIFRNGNSENSKLSAACCLNYLIGTNGTMKEIIERSHHLTKQLIQKKILS
jgi:hypothetical protein